MALLRKEVGAISSGTAGRFHPWALTSRPGIVAGFYFAFITAAEVVTAVYHPVAGILFHVGLLAALVTHAAVVDNALMRRLLLPLTLVPLTRILSISMPLTVLPQIYWYPIIYLPLAVATVVVMRQIGLSGRDIGFRRTRPLWQLLIVPSGVLLGLVEYLILRPNALQSQLTVWSVLLGVSVFVLTTGLVEEWVFRGVLQKVMKDQFGWWFGVIYVSLVFAILHVGFLSVLDLAFVFGVALLFGWLVNWTGSLVGVIVAHGLTNAGLYVVLPLLFR